MIITDLRKIKPIAKKLNMQFDKTYKYFIGDDNLKLTRNLKQLGFTLKYVDGCFYPYLNKVA